MDAALPAGFQQNSPAANKDLTWSRIFCAVAGLAAGRCPIWAPDDAYSRATAPS